MVVGDFDYNTSTAYLELELGLSLAKRNLFLAHPLCLLSLLLLYFSFFKIFIYYTCFYHQQSNASMRHRINALWEVAQVSEVSVL